jgi:hypothetical protein
VARPLSADSRYASQLGISRRTLRILGGAAKLQALSPAALAILLSPQNYGNSQTIHVGGVAACGMGQRRGYLPKGNPKQDMQIEREIQRILVERGLVK